MSDRDHLGELARALAERGLDAWIDGDELPLLWVDVPQTVAIREMVHMTADGYAWDGADWPVTDPGRLADAIAAYIDQYPAYPPPGLHWGQP